MLKAGWSYFMTWSGGFIDKRANGGSDGSTPADFNDPDYLTKTVYSNPNVLTLDKVGNWMSSGAGGNKMANVAKGTKNSAAAQGWRPRGPRARLA